MCSPADSFFVFLAFNLTTSQSFEIDMDFNNGTPGTIVQSEDCLVDGAPAFTDVAGNTYFTKSSKLGKKLKRS